MEAPAACTAKRIGDREFYCFFQLSQMIMGGKWKPKILFFLSQSESFRFGKLRDAIIRRVGENVDPEPAGIGTGRNRPPGGL